LPLIATPSQVEQQVKRGRLPVLAWFVEGGGDTFRFAHLTFQEFLCAEQCLDESVSDEGFVLRWRALVCARDSMEIIHRGWWQQTIQMFSDLASAANARSSSGKP
jgi:predicted NACHT family NTPase